jgi:hypothetical protein
MALAIRFEGLLREETIQDYAELARLGRVTRARMTQIMKLLDLAPGHSGTDPLSAAHQRSQREKPAAHCQPDQLGRATADVREDHAPIARNRELRRISEFTQVEEPPLEPNRKPVPCLCRSELHLVA